MYDDAVRNLLAAVWYQSLKDLKKEQNNDGLREWILNEGRCICVPHFSKKEAEEIINEYLSR